MKIKGWNNLTFFNYGEWDVVKERLEDAKIYCPGRKNLFKALELVPFDKVKVCIIGQDPYPDPKYATGVAFSIPKEIQIEGFPVTLLTLLKEYKEDLHYDFPKTGDLTSWCNQGVLLWNAYPSCSPFLSASHRWPEWELLTKEIVELLAAKDTIFVLLGNFAKAFAKYIPEEKMANVIVASHPSPRGTRFSKNPFVGSRIFTTVNALVTPAIDWKLD